ncbi:WD repeat-containing protein 62 [Camelus dromedarius]|uniref:WD repeat-containing protein 62 n=1 Tax=Camelus dromedarius TaxID=9838 RepID=A0A5N4DPT0_CAMDR|nr:WD repeat-containing protein 62 [Camelus dromedarius]
MVEGRRELLSEEVERGARDQQDDSYLRVPSTSFKDQSPPEVSEHQARVLQLGGAEADLECSFTTVHSSPPRPDPDPQCDVPVPPTPGEQGPDTGQASAVPRYRRRVSRPEVPGVSSSSLPQTPEQESSSDTTLRRSLTPTLSFTHTFPSRLPLHLVLSGEKVEDPLETLEAQSPLNQLESGGVFLILPLHPQMHHLDQGCPGHCGETRAPAGVLPPDPLELSNVGTVVHRLQAPSKKPWTFTTWWAPLQMVSSDEVSAERQQARTELASTFLWIHSQLEANDWLVGTDVASARPSQPGYPLPTHTVPPSQPRFACPAGTLLGAAGAGCAEEARGD